MFFTYILYSQKTKRFYIGQTDNLDRRFLEHNSGKSISTRKGIPWDLIYFQEFECRREAMDLENKIKKRGANRYLNDIHFL
jgi:putative endonuclease